MTVNTRKSLSDDALVLLAEVLTKRMGAAAPNVDRETLDTMTREERQLLCHHIFAEFTDTGLREDWEPNTRGLKLEDLLSAINQGGRDALPKDGDG